MGIRQRVWVDHSVQGALIGRVVLYWLFGLIYLGLGSACFQFCQHPEWSVTEHIRGLLSQCGPWLPCLILIMPLVIFDVVRLSNLFAGPIYRLRRHLLALADNPERPPLTFREDDYWHNLVEPVNKLQTQILELRQQLAEMREVSVDVEGPNPLEIGTVDQAALETQRARHPAPLVAH